MSPIVFSGIAVHRDSSPILLASISIGLIGLLCVIFTSCGSIGQMPTTVQAATSRKGLISISGNPGPATVGKPYNAVLSVTGGSAPYHFSVGTGALPQGLSLGPGTGTISGIPSKRGTFDFTVVATDRRQRDHGKKQLEIAVSVSNPGAPVKVGVLPDSGTLASGAKLQFTATVQNTSNTTVFWSASSGTVLSSGLFTAPVVTATKSVRVTATSAADRSARGSVTVSVTAPATTPNPTPSPLTITTSALPAAQTGVSYNASVVAQGGTTPYSWSVSAGLLPQGLSLDSKTGLISGSASQSGTFTFTVVVTDSASHSATQTFNLDVIAQSVDTGSDDNTYCGPGNMPLFGTTDDVAALPRACMYTTLSATPAPGKIWIVNAGADLQTAINGLRCGDIIQITAGVTISTAGQFIFPALGCDDNHWIWIQSSGITNPAFPPEGTRVTPCVSGIASLPGRPAYPCPTPQILTAKILTSGTSAPITFATGATHYRFMGLEVAHAAAPGKIPALVGMGAGDHVILDRVWLHGTPAEGTFPQAKGATTETQRGVNLAQSHHIALINSYVNDIYCISINGACSDAQAVLGGIGTTANSGWGVYKIVNNFLEAAGQSGALFGGGRGPCTNPNPSLCPFDSPQHIEIRRNHMFKPLQWMPPAGPSSGFAGWPVVKNGFELKNAASVLLEGNIIENTWGGFSQVGYAFLFTPKANSIAAGGLATGNVVQDVTARYNLAKHVGGGIMILAAASDAGDICKGSFRESIHDNLFDGIYQNPTLVQASGYVYDISGSTGMTNDSLHIFHNTASSAGNADILLGGSAVESNFIWRDNIMVAGAYQEVARGTNCDYHLFTILGKMNACWTNYSFLNNLMIGGSTALNFYPATTITSAATPNAAGFVKYQVEGGDLHLCLGVSNPSPSCIGPSPYATASSDGLPVGANITLLNQYTQGVQ